MSTLAGFRGILMTSAWTAKANTAAYVIMWFGSLLAILICVVFFIRNIYPYNREMGVLDNDLERISTRLNEACISSVYRDKINPYTEEGQLNITGSLITMASKHVGSKRVLVCNNPGLDVRIDLSSITNVVIAKNASDTTIHIWTE
jgi:hypothetical protein